MGKQMPLPELAEAMFAKLTDLRYTENYIRYLRSLCDKLLRYAEGVNAEYMTEELKDAFIHDLYGSRKKAARDYAARCAEMLLMVQEYGTIHYKRLTGTVFHGELSALYEEYSNVLQRRVRDSTLAMYRTHLKVSADFLTSQGITDINDVDRNTIVNFTMTLSRFSGKSANCSLNLFSELLRYAFEQKLTREDMSPYCMRVKFHQGEKIPPTFTTDEIERTLAVINRTTAKGKRDYAMLILASRTALRTCDIIGLKLSHLRFDTDTIEISQQKTGKMLTLPLAEEVGTAIIEYLRDGRPETEYDTVFLRHRAPYKPLNRRCNQMIGRYMERAGISNYNKREPGFRAFRHSLAGSMLENNVSIYNIQDYLGHESPNTTMRYVKIDTKGLKNCALEVPLRQSKQLFRSACQAMPRVYPSETGSRA